MKIAFSPKQQLHRPVQFQVRGRPADHPDTLARVESMLPAVIHAGHQIIEPLDYGIAYLGKVHDPRYLDFLATAYERWGELPNSSREVVPNVHPRRLDHDYPDALVGRAGFHLTDLACPIYEETWTAARWNAHSATSAALLVRDGIEHSSYAMCRPPGHHAGKDFAGGFCYLNNAAIAAEILREKYPAVAVLDVDVHHGNGTQQIFYKRADVLTVSLHGDPAGFYPFFDGYANEEGEGAGRGYNANFPLRRGVSDEEYLKTLDLAIDRIRAFKPAALVVSAGFDGYELDPLQWLQITTRGFNRIAQRISRLNIPTVIVQEGGYMSEDLGRNVVAFLDGFGG